jgi:hypothetical protein
MTCVRWKQLGAAKISLQFTISPRQGNSTPISKDLGLSSGPVAGGKVK